MTAAEAEATSGQKAQTANSGQKVVAAEYEWPDNGSGGGRKLAATTAEN